METLFAFVRLSGTCVPVNCRKNQQQNRHGKSCMSPFFSKFNGMVLSLALLAGCTTVTSQSFRTTGSSNVEAAYVATDADFSKYSQLLGEDMGIFYPESSPMPEEDLQRIRQIFRDAFLGELTEYHIVESAGPNVMTVQASLIDLRKADLGDVPDMSSGLDTVARPGVLVFAMEMRDSTTDRVLARAADNTSNPKFGTALDRTTDWNEVQQAAQYWASLFRQFLDQNLDSSR
jgi:hypothetical protein